jgi:hypothetical protein
LRAADNDVDAVICHDEILISTCAISRPMGLARPARPGAWPAKHAA